MNAKTERLIRAQIAANNRRIDLLEAHIAQLDRQNIGLWARLSGENKKPVTISRAVREAVDKE